MAKKRANGEGNIRKRADGRWEGRYTVGRNRQANHQKCAGKDAGGMQGEAKESH